MTRKSWQFLKEADVTPEAVFQQRRQLIRSLGAGSILGPSASLRMLAQGLAGAGLATAPLGLGAKGAALGGTRIDDMAPLAAKRNAALSTDEPQTAAEIVTTYNNFYEFGLDKADPSENAGTLQTRPWTVVVEGACHKPKTFDIEDLLKLAPMEERIYRLRCVEAWSIVVPWMGYPLSALLKAVEPTGNARYVAFETLADRRQMPGLRSPVLDWPYREGLRLDEAQHPLTLLTFGQYGKLLPNQSGAPIRLVVPWKYGYKGAKSIVRIRLTETQPVTAWNQAAPDEYGFYSNVNPNVRHPRWSQATERRLGEGALGGLLAPRRKTEMFNGYGEAVAALYAGMDLKKFH